MAKQLAGISGILGNYISAESGQHSATTEPPSASPTERQNKQQAAKKPPARLGRPPGASRPRRRREKATLRIDATLMANYRDWSWEQRCQLGELVERALLDYHRRHRK